MCIRDRVIIEHGHRIYLKKTNNTVQMNAIVRSTFRLIKTTAWLIALLAVLEVNNIRITSIIAGVGVAGAVFGMAMQDVFKDVLMGMHIINDKSFKVGDVIKIDGDEGIVTLFTLQTLSLIHISQVSMQTGVPTMFGVITTENIEQAIARAGSKVGNKGYDCALSAIEMVNLINQL